MLVAAVVAAAVAFALPSDEERPDAAAAPTPTPGAAPDPLDLVVLGDSIGTGAGATLTYADELAVRLDADGGPPVVTRNLARNGWTTSDLLTALRMDPRFTDALADADLVTVTIGGNDLLAARSAYLAGTCGGVDGLDCVRLAVAALEQRWGAIADEIVAASGDGATLVTMTLYDPFAGVAADDAASAALAEQLATANAAIAATATERGFAVAPIAEAFAGRPELIAADGIHPNDEGQAVIADALAAEVASSTPPAGAQTALAVAGR